METYIDFRKCLHVIVILALVTGQPGYACAGLLYLVLYELED